MTHLHSKDVPVFNSAPCHEDIQWPRGTALCIININLAVAGSKLHTSAALSTRIMPQVPTV